MTSYHVKLTDEAVNDLLKIVNYYTDELCLPDKAAAKKKFILDFISTLSTFPERGKLLIKQDNVRFIKIPNEKFLILYQVIKDSNIVAVTNILYGSPERLETFSKTQD